MYYQYLPLALSTFLWVDCRHIRSLTRSEASDHWLTLLTSPIRLLAIVGAKLFGVMAVGWFLFGLADLGLMPTVLTALIAFGMAELFNYPLRLLVSKQ
jgi:hypothetical protein